MNGKLHVGVVDDLFVHVDQQGETPGDPVVVLLADSYVDQFLLGEQMTRLGLFLLEGEELEDQRDAVSRLQEEGVVLSDHVISLRLGIFA